MQRFLQVFSLLSFLLVSIQMSAQSDVVVTIFEDTNGDGFDGGTTIGGLGGDLVLYEDANSNNVGDVGEETGIVASEGATGVYTFSVAAVGSNNYIVGLANQAPNYYPTIVVAGSADPTITDADSDLDITSLQTTPFMLTSGVNETNVDIGLVAPATIGDLVWEDFDGNGLFDGADAGFDWNAQGIMINLTASSGNGNDLLGNPFAALSLGGGNYEFQNLPPDTYTVEFTQIANNWYRTQDGGDSAPNQISGSTVSFLLESGMTNADQDAGYIQPAKISNFVWEDLNGNGIQDGGEPGVDFNAEGITIDITLVGGAAATDLDGNSPPVLSNGAGVGEYEFNNLAPGDYQVTFGEVAMMWYLSVQNAAGAATDSDPDPTTGVADDGGAGYTLMSGDENEDVDAGYMQPAKISNFVWEDLNGNGIQDGGEPGIDGVDIMITDDLGGGVTDLEGLPVVMTTSAGGGLYEFELLPPGNYILMVNTNVLTNYYLSLQDQAGTPGDAGDAATDSDADQTTGETHTIEIESGEDQEDIDFAYFRSGTIMGQVFHDSDGNGQNGTGMDSQLAGVTVQLADDMGNTPVPDVFGVNIADQVSDGAGMVTFNDVPPGNYSLIYNLPTTPGNWEFTYQDITGMSTDADDVNNDSDTPMGGGQQRTHSILLEGGETEDRFSAGMYKLMSLGSFVWIESDNNGMQDAGEGGADGVIVGLLYDDNFDGTPSFKLAQTVTANPNAGEYLFENLIPGNYVVQVQSDNFGSGGSLEFFQNCSGGGSLTTDLDNDGVGDALLQQNIESAVVELYCVPGGLNLPGPDENLFVDFCFYFECQSTPDPNTFPWVNCETAENNDPICNLQVLDNFCGSMNTANSPGPSPQPLCPDGGAAHNMSWFAFVAGGAGFELQVVPSNCTDAGGFSGIQAGVYTDCTFSESVFCQSDCSTGPITVGGATTVLTPGETYYFFLDGCAGSVCDFEVNVIQGGQAFPLPNPTGLSCDVVDCGPVCPGSEVTFTVEGIDLEIEYNWTIPSGATLISMGDQTGNTVLTQVNEITLSFTSEGSYDIVMNYASNGCGLTNPAVMATVVVENPDNEDLGEFNVCQHDFPFNNGDTDADGNTLVGWNGGPINGPGINITVPFTDPDGCTFDQIIDVIQIDNSPREIVNVALCDDEIPYMYDQLTVTANGQYNNFMYTLVDTPAASGCDSFITFTAIILEHELELDPECLLGGVQIRINDEVMTPAVPNQVNYFWYNMDDPSTELTDSDGFSDILQISENGTYCVDVTLNHFIGEAGEGSCTFTYCETVIIDDLVPPISIAEDWLISPCNATGTVTYTVTNDDPTIEYYNWSITNGSGSFEGSTGQFEDNEVEIDWSTGSGGTLCVYAHNSCGDGPELCIPITPIDAPDVSFDLVEEECQDSIVTIVFTGAVSNGATFDWDFGNGVTETTEGPHDVTYATPGKYYVTLTVDDNGCVSDEIVDSIQIIERLPAPMFTCISTPTSVTLSWNSIPGATGYEITPINGSVTGTQMSDTSYVATGVMLGDYLDIIVQATSTSACELGNPGTAQCFAQDCTEPEFTFSPTRDTICLTTDVGLDTIYFDIVGGTTPSTSAFTGPGIINMAEGVFDASAAGVGLHTINYTYTGDDNCMFSRTIAMHVFEQPIAAFTTDVDTICISDVFTVEYTGGTTGANYIWDFGPDVDMVGSGVGPFDISYSFVGMKTITLTVEKEECTSETITKNVWVEAELPELVIDCDTDATSISFSWNDIADEYEVIIDAASQGIQNDAFYNVTSLTPGTSVMIEVIAISPNKCPDVSDSRTCNATNCPELSVAIDQMDMLICLDSSTGDENLTYTVTGGFMDGSGVAVWSGNGVDPTTGVFDPVAAGEGQHVIALNYSEGECEAEEVSIFITVVNQPTADFDGVQTICEGSQITLNHTGIGGAGAVYTWTTDGAVAVGATDQSTITLVYNDSGVYDISLQVSRAGCDSEIVTMSITVDEMLLQPAIFCADQSSTTITFEWGAVDGATNYEIYIDGLLIGTQTNTSYPITGLNPNDQRSITVIALSDNACPNSSNMELCVAIDCPNTEIVPNEETATYCEGQEIIYDIDYTIVGGFMDGSGVGVFNGPSTNPMTGEVDIASLNPGDHTIFIDYSEGPCDTRDSVVISIIDLPTPSLDFEPKICVTNSLEVTYTGETIAGVSINVTATGNPNNTGTADAPIYQWDMAGTYEMIVTATAGTCEISSETYTVTVEPELLDPVISCSPQTTSIDISWDPVDCASMYIVTIDNVAQPAQSETTYAITGLDPETDVNITVEAISDCECGNSSMSETCTTAPCDAVTIDIVNNTSDCITYLPETVTLDVVFTGTNGDGVGTWSGDFVSPGGIFDYTQSGVGVHDVTFTYQENGCDYSVTEQVEVYDPPMLTVESEGLTCFDSNDGSITYAVTGGDGNYDITINAPIDGFPISATTDGVLNDLAPGMYTLEVTDGNLCMDEVQVNIPFIEAPTFSVTGPPSIVVGSFGDLGLNFGTLDVNDITNLTWYSETETLCDAPDCFELSVSPSVNSLYCVDITLEGGCEVSNCISVNSEFITIINVSNVFSPNGDGSNDNLVIQTNNPDLIATYVRIYDRWGNLVFNVEEPWSPYSDMNYPGWDGTFKGSPLNPGVYVYVMEYIEELGAAPQISVGDVTIIK